MKKYLLCLVLAGALLIIEGQEVLAENIVQNTISNSQVSQYILINCQGDECLQLVEALKNFNQLNTVVEGKSDFDGPTIETEKKVKIEKDVEQEMKNGSLATEKALIEKMLPTVIIVSEQTATGDDFLVEPVDENNAVGQNGTAQLVQAEITSNAVESGNSAVQGEMMNATNKAETAPALAGQKTAVSAKQIRISEIMPAPLTGQKEWVELYNSLDFPVDLSDWQLVEGAGKITKLSGVINANNFIVFEKDSLNNSGDIVILKDAAGLIIDSVSYGDWNDGNVSDNAPKTTGGQTLILSEGNYFVSDMPTPNLANVLTNKTALEEVQAGVLTQSVQSAAAVSPSNVAQPAAPVVQIQKAETALAAEPIKIKESALTPPVYQFSDKIFISEFLADPAGNDDEEWIELFNDGVEPVNLLGWSLDDAEGGSPMYVIKEPIVVGGKDFWVFKKEKTGLVLNNSTDSVVLRDPAGKEISRFDYKNPKEGFSFAKFSDGWQETSILTPGAMNQKSALQVAQFSSTPANVKAAFAVKKPALVRKISLAEAKTITLGAEVIISGAIIVPPNVFGKSIAYLDGLQIYFNKAEWPALAVGEVISARGTISESAGERRLIVKNANDIKKTGKTELLMPLEITALEMTGELAGKLVQLNGTLVEKKANKLIVADDSAEAVVYLKTATKMDSKIYKLENVLKVQGVVGNFNGEWRIMPRSKNDIVNLSAAKLDLPSSSSVPEKSGRGIGRTGTFIVLILLFVAIAGVNIYLAIVHRKVIMGLLRRFTPR